MNPDSTRPVGHELALATIGALATLLVLPVCVIAGSLSLWMPPVVVGAAALVFLRRDSSHGLAVLGAVAVMWLNAAPRALSAWSEVIALLMFTIHTTLAMRTTAPPGAEFGRAVVLRWVRRSVVVALLTGVVYGLALALQNLHQSDAEVVLAAALALLGGLILLLRVETLEDTAVSGPHPRARAATMGRALESLDKKWSDNTVEPHPPGS